MKPLSKNATPAQKFYRSATVALKAEAKRKAEKFQVPEGSIRWLLGRVHVSTPDSEVEADIRRRLCSPQVTEIQRKACVKYALKCHRENQALYCRVIYG